MSTVREGPDRAYWQEYYSRRASGSMAVPSQFAAFVSGEMHEPHQVVEFGCGSGRDAIFFASHGHQVLGIDGAASAVEGCTLLASRLGLDNARFCCVSLGEEEIPGLQLAVGLPVLVYARFFVHAITDAQELEFLMQARRLLENGGQVAVEFRTHRDAALEKVTEKHYRRFVDPAKFHERVVSLGFVADYVVEGFGYAKYKRDDAHVARFLLSRVGSGNV